MTKIMMAFVCFAALSAGCAMQSGSEAAQNTQETRDQLRREVSRLQASEVADLASDVDPESTGRASDEEPTPDLSCSFRNGCLTCCAVSQCCTTCEDGSGFCNF